MIRTVAAATVMPRGYGQRQAWQQSMVLMPTALHCYTADSSGMTRSGNWVSGQRWNMACPFSMKISGQGGRKGSGFPRNSIFIASNTAAVSTAKKFVICRRAKHNERLRAITDNPGTYSCNARHIHYTCPAHTLDR